MTDRELVEALLGGAHISNVAITDRAAARLQALAAQVKVLEAALGEHGGRYWEARYRDEVTENERLRRALREIRNCTDETKPLKLISAALAGEQ